VALVVVLKLGRMECPGWPAPARSRKVVPVLQQKAGWRQGTLVLGQGT
jgi:hypothetical protein